MCESDTYIYICNCVEMCVKVIHIYVTVSKCVLKWYKYTSLCRNVHSSDHSAFTAISRHSALHCATISHCVILPLTEECYCSPGATICTDLINIPHLCHIIIITEPPTINDTSSQFRIHYSITDSIITVSIVSYQFWVSYPLQYNYSINIQCCE